jgi:hypothetical protein
MAQFEVELANALMFRTELLTGVATNCLSSATLPYVSRPGGHP